MKTRALAVAALAVAVAVWGCSKNKETMQSLEVSVSGNLHKDQPVTVTFPGIAANSDVNWSVSRAGGTGSVHMAPNGNTAVFRFPTAGDYTVTGMLGQSTASVQLTVDSVNYLPANGTITAPFNTNEQIRITASRNDSSATASGLVFTMETTGYYSCQASSLSFTAVNNGNAFTITFTGINLPAAGCVTGTARASGTVKTNVPLNDGTTTLTIVFNGTTYTGAVVKANNKYSINWNHTTGVLILPASL